jgi:hypothetical protein
MISRIDGTKIDDCGEWEKVLERLIVNKEAEETVLKTAGFE